MGFQTTDKWARVQKYLQIKEYGSFIFMLLEIIGELESRISALEAELKEYKYVQNRNAGL